MSESTGCARGICSGIGTVNTTSWITLATGLLAGLGIGSVVTAWIQHFLQQRAAIDESQRQDLEKRYKVIILLMYAAVNFDSNRTVLRMQQPDLESRNDVLGELKAEWYNMLLFSSANTQQCLYSFTGSPTAQNLHNTAIAMRKDLGREEMEHSLDRLGLEFEHATSE